MTREIETLRAEIDAVHVDLRIDKVRSREFQILCLALAGSERYEDLIADMGIVGQMERATILSAFATGIQIGMDVEKKRRNAK